MSSKKRVTIKKAKEWLVDEAFAHREALNSLKHWYRHRGLGDRSRDEAKHYIELVRLIRKLISTIKNKINYAEKHKLKYI